MSTRIPFDDLAVIVSELSEDEVVDLFARVLNQEINADDLEAILLKRNPPEMAL